MTTHTENSTKNTLPRVPEIIQRPDLVPIAKRGVLALIAAVGWALWLYLLLPLGALLAWWFGYQRVDLFVLTNPSKTLETIHIYALIILAGGLLFIFWAVYNWLRFRGMDRRNAPKPVGSEDIGQAFHLPRESVQLAQGGTNLVFHYSDEGEITRITASGVRAPPQISQPAQPADNSVNR